MTEPTAVYKVNAPTRALTCPFCKASNLTEWIAYFDDEQVPAAECDDCGLQGPIRVLSRLERKGWHYPRDNDDLLNMPAPGEIVVLFYEGEEGEEVGPVICTPVDAVVGVRAINGGFLYRRCIRWHEIPEEDPDSATLPGRIDAAQAFLDGL